MEQINSDVLQILTCKTWDLHGRINAKLNENGFTFCGHCSNHGRYFVISDSTVEEREKIIAVRDSLKDVHAILVYLQRVKSSQKRQIGEALSRFAESRKLLIQRIKQWPENGEKFDAFEEMIAFLGDGKAAFPPNFLSKIMEEKVDQNKNVKGISFCRFLVNSTRFALEFLVMFASIYSTINLCRSHRQQSGVDDSRMRGKLELFKSDSDMHFDVLCGRG